ncbi:unnamed protein product [Schistosoma spindalis]|nr:unnamed protein product [Schistosoma spindale]
MGAQIVKANLAVTILWIWCLMTTETNNCSVPIVTDETGTINYTSKIFNLSLTKDRTLTIQNKSCTTVLKLPPPSEVEKNIRKGYRTASVLCNNNSR